jgi:hypothetical protein
MESQLITRMVVVKDERPAVVIRCLMGNANERLQDAQE